MSCSAIEGLKEELDDGCCMHLKCAGINQLCGTVLAGYTTVLASTGAISGVIFNKPTGPKILMTLLSKELLLPFVVFFLS